MKLTINIVVKNNEQTIENTLNSIYELDSNILIANMGSNDKTINICKKFKKVKIFEFGNVKNISFVKNELIQQNKTDWLFFIEPWEYLISPKEKLKELISKIHSYKINILQNDIITKQTRLWHKNLNLSFKNPVFETVDDKNSQHSDIYLGSYSVADRLDVLTILENWRELKPLSCEPLYYIGFYYLKNKEWKKFLSYANIYLCQEKNNKLSFFMTHYYCAMVKCYIESEKNIQEALGHILYCLSENPLMAEFWCLLGDIYYVINDYEKAMSFYENAILLGCKRLKNDNWPIEISKYKDYPKKMIENCLKIKENIRLLINKENLIH